MSLSSNFPTSKPSLNLDFANVGALDPRITFTRSSSATYTNSLGLIATAATNVARFDYDPVTLAARGLLVEESRTNVVTYSEQFGNAAWAAQAVTVTANTGVAPDGTTTADKIAADNTLFPHALYNAAPLTLTATIYTWSIFVKAAGNNFANLTAVSPDGGARYAIAVDLTNGTVTQTASSGTPTNTSSFVSNYGNGWYRIGISMTAASSSNSYFVVMGIPTGTPTRDSSSLDPLYTGNNTDGIYIWGAQVEAGSFATSYIPTVASTVTRSADVASVNTLSPWYQGGTAETWYAEIIYPQLLNGTRFVATEAAATPYNTPLFNSGSTLAMFDGTATRNFGTMSGSSSAQKIAVAYSGTTSSGSINGAIATASFDGSMDSPTIVYLGGYTFGSYINGHLCRVAYYPRRLTNAELQALTA